MTLRSLRALRRRAAKICVSVRHLRSYNGYPDQGGYYVFDDVWSKALKGPFQRGGEDVGLRECLTEMLTEGGAL